MNNLIKKLKQGLNIKAIIYGLLVDIIGTLITGIIIVIFIANMYLKKYEKFDNLLNTPVENKIRIFTLIIALFYTIIGGYITGRISKDRKMLNALVLGVLNLIIGIFFMSFHPNWFDIIGFILTIPCTILGGWLAEKKCYSLKFQ